MKMICNDSKVLCIIPWIEEKSWGSIELRTMVDQRQKTLYSNGYAMFCNSKCILKFIGNFISENTGHVSSGDYEIQTFNLNIDKRR